MSYTHICIFILVKQILEIKIIHSPTVTQFEIEHVLKKYCEYFLFLQKLLHNFPRIW